MIEENKNSNSKKENVSMDNVATDVSDVFVAVLGIGATLAKTFAEATAGSKKVPQPEEGCGPINVIVHYGMAGITNVVGTIVNAVKSKNDQESSINKTNKTDSQKIQKQKSSPIPLIERGATLRIPLTIENPTSEPMQGLVFSCTNIEGKPTAPGQPLTNAALRFQPEVLDIAPKDFEKLTVFIETANDTAPGYYIASIGIGSDTFESKVHFKVIEN